MFRFFSRQVKPELFWTTDVHSHVCPGIDDGAGTVEMAVELVGGMYDMGFRRMITTPHITDEVFPNTAESIGNSFSILTSALDQSGVGMEMDVAAEHRIDDLFYSMLRENSVRLLPGGKHILIENAWSGEPYGLDALIKNLIKEHGLIPVLAHPERYEYYHHNRDRFADLHKKGVKLQINLLSLSGLTERNSRRQRNNFSLPDLSHLWEATSTARAISSQSENILPLLISESYRYRPP